jgi:hypothetical protein
MLGFNGGLMGVRRTPTVGAASGLWFQNEQSVANRAAIWPAGPFGVGIGDPYQGGFFAGYISHTANGVATHALIVAPQATGATGSGYPVGTDLLWKTSDTTTAGTTSTFDGAANTAAMVTAGIAAHPAANFCVGLSIGGYSDWYLPARDELAIAYDNLKPTTASNSTSSGINDYSVPKRTANRTAIDPAQTPVASFQSGGAEAFSAEYHYSSTEISGAVTSWLTFANGTTLDAGTNKTSALRVRAFRKVTL